MKSIIPEGVKIIQMSPPRTGSTLLLNIVHGLYAPDNPVIYWHKWSDTPPKGEAGIIKTHDCSYKAWAENFPDHKLYFVCSERREIKALIPLENNICIDNEFVLHNNVVVFRYDELLYAKSPAIVQMVERKTVVERIANRLKSIIPLPQDLSSAIDRTMKMDALCDELKNEPFSYWDKHYGIHGSHRGGKR